jgi:serine/threonine protein kinase
MEAKTKPIFNWECERFNSPEVYDATVPQHPIELEELIVKINVIVEKCEKLQLPPIDPTMVGKLYEIADSLEGETSYKLKKGTLLPHWDPQSKEKITIARTCTLAAAQGKKVIFINFDEMHIDEGSDTKAKLAGYIRIKKNGAIKVYQAVRLSSLVTKESKMQRFVNRIKMTEACQDIPQVLPQEYWSRFRKKDKGYKLNIFSMLYDKNLFDLLTEVKLSYEGILQILLELAKGLKKLSINKGLIHRDLKLENIFIDVDFNVENVCEILDLVIADLDYCVKKDNQEDLLKTRGSLPYVCPTIVLLAYHEFWKFNTLKGLLGISTLEEIPTILGPTQDLWGLGCILYACLYGRLPPPCKYLLEIIGIRREQPMTTMDEQLKIPKIVCRLMDYEKSLAQMEKSLEKEKDRNFFTEVLSRLLKVNPRDRISIEQLYSILKAHAKDLKSKGNEK